MIEIELSFLLTFMILGAMLAIFLSDLLSSVIALGTVGLGLSLAFLLLQAPDIAATQLVVEILCLIILVRATIQKDLPDKKPFKDYFSAFTAIIFLIVFLSVAYQVLKLLPGFGSAMMKVSGSYIKEAFDKLGSRNIISSIILEFRILDTLCEATILFTAVIGSIAVLREVGKIRKK
ncbi:MAG: DUF4040 domain-containing protein [Elusimicrobia bacterium]|nr:DUF4040 domain-containing protein [Candidatus Liberimonas magnetica]